MENPLRPITKLWWEVLCLRALSSSFGLFSQTRNLRYIFFSQCVSGRNSTNPAIWLVPGASEFSHPARSRWAETTFIKNIWNLSGNVLNDLCYYVSKNISVKPLSWNWIISLFITICLLIIVQFVTNLAMITTDVRVFRTPFVVL